jgi:branched-subunit amino acid transport protein
MTWPAVLALAAGTLVLKAVGPVLLGGRTLPAWLATVVGLLPPALLAALVAIQTLGDGSTLVVDARLPAVAVGAVAMARGASLIVVIVLATVTAALLRLAGMP